MTGDVVKEAVGIQAVMTVEPAGIKVKVLAAALVVTVTIPPAALRTRLIIRVRIFTSLTESDHRHCCAC